MDFAQYVEPELLILVPFLYAIGMMLKNAAFINDKFIPLILTGISLIFSCLYVLGMDGINITSIFTAVVQGILCAATAVYGNQLFKQSTK